MLMFGWNYKMPSNRKDKLIALRKMVNLETGEICEESFGYENALYNKGCAMKSLNAQIKKCQLCEGMNIPRLTENCPGWGDLNAKVFFIGQSLHKYGIHSDLPFILGSGYLLDAALRLSGLLRKDVFISNVVHCHPPKNRASTTEEKENCLSFLEREIDIVEPELIVALGNDAHWAVIQFGIKALCIKHPASFLHSAPEDSIDWILKLSKEIDKVYK